MLSWWETINIACSQKHFRECCYWFCCVHFLSTLLSSSAAASQVRSTLQTWCPQHNRLNLSLSGSRVFPFCSTQSCCHVQSLLLSWFLNESLNTLSRWFCWLCVTHWQNESQQHIFKNAIAVVSFWHELAVRRSCFIFSQACWQQRVIVECFESHHAFPKLLFLIQKLK